MTQKDIDVIMADMRRELIVGDMYLGDILKDRGMYPDGTELHLDVRLKADESVESAVASVGIGLFDIGSVTRMTGQEYGESANLFHASCIDMCRMFMRSIIARGITAKQ